MTYCLDQFVHATDAAILDLAALDQTPDTSSFLKRHESYLQGGAAFIVDFREASSLVVMSCLVSLVHRMLLGHLLAVHTIDFDPATVVDFTVEADEKVRVRGFLQNGRLSEITYERAIELVTDKDN